MTTLYDLLGELSYSNYLSECMGRNELGDAELFATMFAKKYAFDHSENRWYIWNEPYWAVDKIGRVGIALAEHVAEEYLHMADLVLKKASSEATVAESRAYTKRAGYLRSTRYLQSVLKFAVRLESIGLTGDEWNLSPKSLPVSNGIIDLSTGVIRQCEPEDYIRSHAPTEWLGLDRPAPNWERFLLEIFAGDNALISFVQRLLGYAIGGDPREQVLPIFSGEGANGKSTLMDNILSVLGSSFSLTTMADFLMEIRNLDGERAKPFVMALRNKRIVWASETQGGHRLNTGLVKQLTGDGNVTARELYGRPVTFQPSHTIILVTNDPPQLPDGSDYAMLRRLLLVPFGIRFVDDPKRSNERKKDPASLAGLNEEKSGILAWLVRGHISYLEQRLNPPQSVQIATTKYHEGEDVVGRYIKERLTLGGQDKVAAGDLYRDYEKWCNDNGCQLVSNKSFGRKIKGLCGESRPEWVSGRTQKVYTGIGIRSN